MSKIISNYKHRPKQKDIANACGVSESAVSHILKGRRKSPKLRAQIEAFIKRYQAA